MVKELLRDGADVHQRCRWTHMTALHYAAYFDVAPVLDLLLRDPKGNFFPFLFCCLFTLIIYLYTLLIYLYNYLFLIEANISVWILMV